MENLSEQEKLFLSHKDVLQYAEEYFNNEQIVSDLIEWSEASPDNEEERQLFWIACVFMSNSISAFHRRADLSLRKALKGNSTMQKSYSSFKEDALKPISYEIDHKNGWHSIYYPWNDTTDSDGIYIIGRDIFVEKDWEYCCERCNGKREPFQNELVATGFYIGWKAHSFFLALAPVEELAFHSLNMDGSDSNIEVFSLKAAFSPWNL